MLTAIIEVHSSHSCSDPHTTVNPRISLYQFFSARRPAVEDASGLRVPPRTAPDGAGRRRSAGGKASPDRRGRHRHRQNAGLPGAGHSGRGKRVIISTGTKNLQEQLFYKDVPFLAQHCPDLEVCYMKGRNNYLCRKKLYDLTDQPMLSGLEEIEQYRAIRSGTKPPRPATAPSWSVLAGIEPALAQARRPCRKLYRARNARSSTAASSPTCAGARPRATSSSSTTISSSPTWQSRWRPKTRRERRHPARVRRRNLRRGARTGRRCRQLLRRQRERRTLRRTRPRPGIRGAEEQGRVARIAARRHRAYASAAAFSSRCCRPAKAAFRSRRARNSWKRTATSTWA